MAVIRGDTTSSLIPKDNQNLDSIRTWATSRLANLIIVSSMAGNIEWQSEILRFLFIHGYFNVSRKCTINGKVWHSFPFNRYIDPVT